MLFRAMGKNAFGQIQDESGRLQVVFNKNITEVDQLNTNTITPMKFIEKKLDLGDIIGVQGHLFTTQKGELTLFVKKVTLLSKSLLPLPDKHSGLADKETIYRKRWLDLISDRDSFKRFQTRSEIIALVREFVHSEQFMEVETNILQNIYGGAEAQPFVTHLNALHQDMYARIALEIALKKLLVGGMHRAYEIGKVFRNEGIDRTHNPEFTMLEAYAAYQDYNYMMTFIENLFSFVATKLFGKSEITLSTPSGDKIISVKGPWKRMTMVEAIKTYANIDPTHLSDDEMKQILIEKTELDKDEIVGLPRGLLIASLFEELAEPHLIEPHHILDHPIETTPLCKLHRDPKLAQQGFVERFETFIAGAEIANSYTELNDPILQRKLLTEQREHDEAHPVDEEFIEAICQGMPPAAGIGIGIDRMVMLFTQASSIRDVVFFPLMRSAD
jgi:lysyl-tRNA synthetase, class II